MLRYIVVTLDDAQAIAAALPPAPFGDGPIARIRDRLRADTGADMQEIVDTLSALPICAACNIEAQESSCHSLDARKLGRRLRRLLERARGE